ncbi:hypothetical protein PR202_gb27107 [Eleusine coracana subsp. coracana]|uniref:RING-type E3 ubiquitin transferase n=1 Tax=Eleusine coracana subsp. coracana TaxID=191504 RepID=A0AAV5FUG2_ELECO|nr:hypothetical protein PR202_gb27107 [Eleusine coracana subsp. coracana]
MSNEMHRQTTGCLPVDQSCLALSRLSHSHRGSSPHACCTATSYLAVLAIIFASLLTVLSVLGAIRCYLVRRRAGNRVTGDATAMKQAAGLGEAAIAALPKFKYRGDDVLDCAICIHAVADGEVARRLPRCGHVFHWVCVDTWLTEHATCPVCRAEVIELSWRMPAGAWRRPPTRGRPARLENVDRDLEAQ